MSSGRGKGGRTGIAGNVNVALEKSDGTNTPLPADDEGLLIAKLFGEDNNGNDNAVSTDSKGRLTVKQSDSNRIIQGEDSGGSVQPVATDSAGRLKVKDVQFDGTVDIGDLQILNTSEQKIDPATEGTLSNIETNTTGLAQNSTLENTNTNLAGIDNELSVIENNTSGLAQENTLATIETNTSGIATESTLSTIETNTNGLFEANDFTETRTITQNNAGLFESSDFTEDRNVRELQNETGVTTGTDTGGGSLPSNSVPDGKAVSVKAQFGNAGAVQINGDYPLLEGDSVSLQVQNTDQISYTTDNGTESVAFIVEG